MNPFSEALNYLKDKSPHFALMMLRPLIEYPDQLDDEQQWGKALEILSQIYRQLGNPSLADLCQHASIRLNDSASHHQLGHALIDSNEPTIAATVLRKALKHAPFHVDILTELVSSLELLGLYDDARRYLINTPAPGFLPQYLLAFETLMVGDIGESRNLYTQLKPSDENDQYLKERLERVFNRIDCIKDTFNLHPSELRSWHFVLTGGLLLHLSPTETMGIRGRYEGLEDTEALCLEGIRRLAAVLEIWDVQIPQVHAYPNPESIRLGHAIAGYFNVTVKENLIPEEPGLFVAYDMDGIIPEVLSNLKIHQPGLTIFSHALRWTIEHSFTPDITNLFYDTLVSPWNRHTIFPWRSDLPSGPPTASDQELAQHILEAKLPANSLDDLPALRSLAKIGKEVAASLRNEGRRERYWSGYRVPT